MFASQYIYYIYVHVVYMCRCMCVARMYACLCMYACVCVCRTKMHPFVHLYVSRNRETFSYTLEIEKKRGWRDGAENFKKAKNKQIVQGSEWEQGRGEEAGREGKFKGALP